MHVRRAIGAADDRLQVFLAGRYGRLLLLVVNGVAVALLALQWWRLGHGLGADFHGQDSHIYWSMTIHDPYHGGALGEDAFLYSPPIAMLVAPLTALPWTAFYLLIAGLSVAALAWMVGPPVALLLVLVVRPVYAELWVGNIHLLLAAAIVASFRAPGLWAFPLLTKVTPGIGLVWPLVRREWRSLKWALGTTGVVIAVTAAIAPGLWLAWISVLVRSSNVYQPHQFLPLPLLLRLAIAAALIAVAARANQRWVVPVAAMAVLPGSGIMGLSMGAGALALMSRRWRLLAFPIYVVGAAIWLRIYQG